MFSLRKVSYELIKSGFGPGSHGVKDGYQLHCYFQDKLGIKDYCVLKVFRNDTILDRNFLYDGKFTDGKKVDFNRFGASFNKGDKIVVELITMSKINYEYVSTLGNVIASSGKGPGGVAKTGTPANPNSNISNGALGFFGAYSIKRDSLIIQ